MLVTLVSKQGIFRDMLSGAVEAAGHELKEAVERIEQISGLTPDECVIIHVDSVEPGLVSELDSLRSDNPAAPMTIVCASGLQSELRDTLTCQVNAVIPDDRPLDFVIGSLAVVAEGYSLFETDRLQELRAGSARPCENGARADGPSLGAAKLSKRELMILGRIRDGQSNKEIAKDLQISESTVKVHMRSIFQKTRARNRTQAAIWASARL